MRDSSVSKYGIINTLAALAMLAFLPSIGWTNEADRLIALAPLIQPQPDGVLCLNAEAAARILSHRNQLKLMNGQGGKLAVKDGCFSQWEGSSERPYWRIVVKQTGRYRVVINYAAGSGRESTAKIYFHQGMENAYRACPNSNIPSTGSWNTWNSFSMGDTHLEAGEYTVEYQPSAWTSPQHVIHLRDIRVLPLEPMYKQKGSFGTVIRQTGLDKDPEILRLTEIKEQAEQKLRKFDKLRRRRDFENFGSYDQFLAYDRAQEQFIAAINPPKIANDRLSEAILKKARELTNVTDAQRAILDTCIAVESTLLDGYHREYPKVVFTPAPSSKRQSLFPVGDLDELPMPKLVADDKVLELTTPPPPDAAKRMARFESRNSDAGIAELGRQLQAALIAGTPGLESFEACCKSGQWRDALDAYRVYFFDKLADPEKYGARTENFVHEGMVKSSYLKAPIPEVVELNMHGSTLAKAWRDTVRVKLGEPGAVWWAPADLAPPPGSEWTIYDTRNGAYWKTEAGNLLATRITFYSQLRNLAGNNGQWQSGYGFFPNLLFDYTVNNRSASLERWCAYLDDFSMNGRADELNCPISIREALLLEPQQVRCMLNLLRVMLDERPQLTTDFNSATLARLILMLVQDYAPYNIRGRRAQQANWGMMGICDLQHVSTFLHEFRAMTYVNRETWRMWGSCLIQHRTLDGENIEAWDTGHNPFDWIFAISSVPYAHWSPEIDRLRLDALDDHLRVAQRSLLIHLSPAGFYWPRWRVNLNLFNSDLRSRYLPPIVRHRPLDMVEIEPTARQRIETIMGSGKPAEGAPPSVVSDLAPYASMAYLRDSWQPGAAMLIFQNFETRTQDLAYCPKTGYSLSRGGRYLIEVCSLAVDGRPDNRFVGHPHTGGKTGYCGQAGRNVLDTRFLATERFDYVDGWQDTPYALTESIYPERGDHFGHYRSNDGRTPDPAPITDVKDLRQVFHVRGESLWLVADRVEAPAAASHEYTQFMSLPARLPEAGFAERVALLAAADHRLVQRDPEGRWIRTDNPGFENVSAWFFAPQPLQVANRIDWRTRQPIVDKAMPLETIQARLKAGLTYRQLMITNSRDGNEDCFVYPSSVRWTGTGNQSFITVIAERPASSLESVAAGDARTVEPLHGSDGCLGTHVITASGAEVWLQTGPQRSNKITAGPARAKAESLLAVVKNGELSGLVIGGSGLTLKGKAYPQTGSFQYVLGADGRLATSPILRPIDTVRISPSQNVFTDSIKVSFAIPTHDTSDIEYHYTLDGSDPTLASPLYRGPFNLHETTRVKVRPFRKGLKETPWNMPGTLAGKTVWATFRKEAMRPSTEVTSLKPGLAYEYFEDDWLKLFTYAGCDGVLAPKASGTVKALLGPEETTALRQTDRAYAIRYTGHIDIPADGIYTFYAPEHFLTSTMDAGYDLRVFIDGQEWFPNPDLHAENTWCIALAKGQHTFKVTYVDYRWKQFRNEYWLSWQEEEMWQGTPVLEVSGPEMQRQPVPSEWLNRDVVSPGFAGLDSVLSPEIRFPINQ